MKRRLISLAATIGIAVGATLAVASPAQAAPAVLITRVYYDAPGSPDSTANVGGEYIRLTSKRSTTINLKYWTVRDKANHIYRFSSNFYLKPGYSVVIRTGKGTNTSTTRYWGLGWHVWNNKGDAAYLRNSAGTLIDSCSWAGGGAYTNC